jgi:predicted ATPase/DNA-binding SARP family transcriptional activator
MMVPGGGAVHLAILGPVEVRSDDGLPVPITGGRLRTLLTVLALEPGRTVATGRLIDLLWGESAPGNAGNALQSLVYRLRAAIGRDAVEGDAVGYRLAIDPDRVDAHRFTRLLAEARVAEPGLARVLLKEALGLWRGPALADLDDPGAAGRLEEARLLAVEEYAAACLAQGDPAQALSAAAIDADRYPVRERLQGQRIAALYALGRQAEALRAYEQTRRTLADELGVDPSAELTALHLSLLRGDPPVGAAARSGPGALPAQLTSFVGRDGELSQVAALVDGHRLVTLTGPGGAGKTRLALATAGQADRPARLVELAPLGDPDEVVGTVLAELGIRDKALAGSALPGPVDPAGRLVEALADRSLLIVLDNCEHVIDAAARLAATVLAGCPQVRVLATSREPLGVPGEALYPVPPLELPAEHAAPDEIRRAAAVRLFAERAAAVTPGRPLDDVDIAAVGRICRRLDGLPLAIELAAARLRLLPPGQIDERLDDRFRLLTGGPRTVQPRHQTLRAVVAWSFEPLDEAERALARRMSVFAGSAPLPAIEAVCGAGGDLLDPLTALVDKSLVEAAGGRYRMLETIRAYAAGELADGGETARYRAAHAGYFLELAETAGPHLRMADQVSWATRIIAERDNFAAALRFAVDTGDAATGLRLCAAMIDFWFTLGFRAEAVGWAHQVLALVPEGPPDGLCRAYTLCWIVASITELGSAVFDQERMAEAGAESRRLLGAAEREGPLPPLLSFSWVLIDIFTGRLLPAVRRLAAYQRRPDPWLAAAATMFRGMLRISAGRPAAAIPVLERAEAAFRTIGDRSGQSQALMALGEAATVTGDQARAVRLLAEASDLLEGAPGSEEGHLVFARMAGLRAQSGDLDGARRELDRARSAMPARGEPGSDVHLRLVEADLARREGDLATAIAAYQSLRADLANLAGQADPTGSLAGIAQQRAMVACHLGRLLAGQGDREQALDLCGEALGALGGVADLPMLANVVDCHTVLADSPQRVAMLVGAADGLRGRPAANPEPDLADAIGRARAALGPDGYAAARARGRAMDRDALRDYLLKPSGGTPR